MQKILCFVYESMADFEITLACHMLGWNPNKELISVGYEKVPVKASSNLQYLRDMTVKEAISLDDIDALIIPGGFERTSNPELIELIQKLDKDKKLICAICAAPEFLAIAGILDNHSYTTTLDENHYKENGLKNPFPFENYLERNVVRHGNIITAKGQLLFYNLSSNIFTLFSYVPAISTVYISSDLNLI
ncbi:DJ-1/PfpI family protein [Anaeromicropila herbilytica]|uniref:Protease n=1 Tax=Anaeromicropila herbilytica TaxID=2785025 RepID=A0A7R7EN23_9FIRM|nr:DJ-1/PfpI family protein [Anaeromicropila herbilytica]BCN31886.1 protease [Anaeromicropila herbilytica]